MTSLDTYRLLGRSGLRVSPLCLGTMTFGTEFGWGSDEAESRSVFDAYADAGGNFIDTAIGYTRGTSERFLGRLLNGRRDQFVVGTKFGVNFRPGDPNAGGNHKKAIVQSLEESLNRLQTDHIDLYWLHMWEYRTPVDEVMRALDDLVRAGKILYIACSDTPAWIVSQAQIMAELRGWTRFIALQAEYSLVERTSERDLIPMADACGLGVMAWSPLGGGILTGKYSRADLETADESPAGRLAWLRRDGRLTKRHIEIAQCVQQIADERGETAAEIALAWVRQQPGVASTIIGARTKEQLSSNIASLSVQLEHSELDRLDSISAIDLGFPRSFIDGPSVKAMISGGAAIA